MPKNMLIWSESFKAVRSPDAQVIFQTLKLFSADERQNICGFLSRILITGTHLLIFEELNN